MNLRHLAQTKLEETGPVRVGLIGAPENSDQCF